MAIEVTNVRKVHEGRSSFVIATLRNAGEEYQRSVEDHGPAVTVLPYDPERRVAILVEQVRAGPLYAAKPAVLVESPAGLRDGGETPEDTARREVMEEVGLRLTTLEHVGTVWTMPSFSTEQVDLYLAPFGASDRVQSGGGLAEEHEHIVVKEVPLTGLLEMVDRKQILDMKTLLLVLALARRHPKLILGDGVLDDGA